MKRSVLAGLGMLVSVGAASAADLPPRSMPYKAPAYVMAYNWTGFYAGINGGYAWGGSKDLDLTGAFIGGQIGYNWQAAGSPWVIGIEVDSAWADLGQTDTFVTGAGLLTVSTNTNYVGSARLRAGYAFDRTLLYITGGVGWINNELSAIAVVPPVAVGANQSQFHVGGVIGAGIEHAFAPNWTGKLEYIYSNYSSETYFNAISASADTHTLRVGLNYQIR